MANLMAQIEKLPEPIRQRALYAVAATEAYGSKLVFVEVKQCGGALHCLLHFDGGIIEFVSPLPAGLQGNWPGAIRKQDPGQLRIPVHYSAF
jgi:hypothetical protein